MSRNFATTASHLWLKFWQLHTHPLLDGRNSRPDIAFYAIPSLQTAELAGENWFILYEVWKLYQLIIAQFYLQWQSFRNFSNWTNFGMAEQTSLTHFQEDPRILGYQFPTDCQSKTQIIKSFRLLLVFWRCMRSWPSCQLIWGECQETGRCLENDG